MHVYGFIRMWLRVSDCCNYVRSNSDAFQMVLHSYNILANYWGERQTLHWSRETVCYIGIQRDRNCDILQRVSLWNEPYFEINWCLWCHIRWISPTSAYIRACVCSVPYLKSVRWSPRDRIAVDHPAHWPEWFGRWVAMQWARWTDRTPHACSHSPRWQRRSGRQPTRSRIYLIRWRRRIATSHWEPWQSGWLWLSVLICGCGEKMCHDIWNCFNKTTELITASII